MSRGLYLKKQLMKRYFENQEDSRTIQVDGTEDIFPAIFTFAAMDGDKDSGNVKQKKRVPHLTFFSGYADLLIDRVTKVNIPMDFDENGDPIAWRIFTVYRTIADLTNGTFQAEAWLL